MNLKTWIKTLPAEEQDCFFRQAARFFTNTELSEIIRAVSTGSSIYSAHLKTGVLDRYIVDLNHIRINMQS